MTWLFLALALIVVPLGSTHTLRLAPAAVGRSWRLPVPSERAVLVGLATSTFLVAALGGLAIGGALGVAGLCATRLVGTARRRRRGARENAQAIAAVRALVAELDAGRQLDDARAMTGLSSSAANSALASVEHATLVSSGSGAPLVGVLGVVVDDLVAEQERHRAVAVKISSTRASALLMAVLPAVGMVLGAGLGADPLGVLTHTPLGHGLVLVAVVLETAGLVWTDAIAHRATLEYPVA